MTIRDAKVFLGTARLIKSIFNLMIRNRIHRIGCITGSGLNKKGLFGARNYRVLALESSCDDSCVALLEKRRHEAPKIIDHLKMTLDSKVSGGVIPTRAHEFHQNNIGGLVQQMVAKHGLNHNVPDVVCCTRGPGMVGSLSASLQLAKGLSIAWNKPFIGVHHMLGHILTAKLPDKEKPWLKPPQFPFLSLLCSGGHTMLVHLKSLTQHEIIIDTMDIAVGDAIDKCARELGLSGNLLGKELERFINDIPEDQKHEFEKISTNDKNNRFNFLLKLPLRGPSDDKVPENLKFTFSSFLSTIQFYKNKRQGNLDKVTTQFLAYKIQHTIFMHIIDRVNISLVKHGIIDVNGVKGDAKFKGVQDLVFSGGVASNKAFRSLLETHLKVNHINNSPDSEFNFHFPDPSLCTDNAIMIGIAGIDILEQSKKVSDLNVLPVRKWPLNDIFNVDGWVDVSESEVEKIVCE